jgi:hypothetical protein
MRARVTLLVLIGALSPALVGMDGCAAHEKSVAHKWPQLRLGMTPGEVKDILGQPGCYQGAIGCGDVKAKLRRAVRGKRTCLDWVYWSSGYRVCFFGARAISKEKYKY